MVTQGSAAPGLPRFRKAHRTGRLLEEKSLARYLSAGAGTRPGRFHLPMNFFSELKRRNVYKVAVAYAVVGWLVIQVTATIVPALHLPDGLTTAVVVLTLIGFPVALVIAWAFEMTPEGMKRTEDVDPFDSRSGQVLSDKRVSKH